MHFFLLFCFQNGIAWLMAKSHFARLLGTSDVNELAKSAFVPLVCSWLFEVKIKACCERSGCNINRRHRSLSMLTSTRRLTLNRKNAAAQWNTSMTLPYAARGLCACQTGHESASIVELINFACKPSTAPAYRSHPLRRRPQ
jgi:hypothetical protein